MASSLNAVPAGAQDFLLPPTVAAALAEAEAKQQLAQVQQGPAGPAAPPQQAQHQQPPPPQQPQQPAQPAQDASGAADAFLSSLSDLLGGPGASAAPAAGAEPAPPLPAEPPPEAELEAEAERPVDLFKAIFEDSDEEEEREQEELEEQVWLDGAAALSVGHLAWRNLCRNLGSCTCTRHLPGKAAAVWHAVTAAKCDVSDSSDAVPVALAPWPERSPFLFLADTRCNGASAAVGSAAWGSAA